MKRSLPVFAFLVLIGGCGSIFDPRPYVASEDCSLFPQTLKKPICTAEHNKPSSEIKADMHVSSIKFTDLSKAQKNLELLSVGYAQKRNSFMWQQYAFDIPMFGLALATAVAGVYGAPANVVLGLGLGSAGAAGTRAYFSPRTLIAAYGGAAEALSCASSVATQLDTINTTKMPGDGVPKDIADKLLIALVDEGSTPKSTDPVTVKAYAALASLNAALGILEGAPARLESFADAIIRSTTAKAVDGVQNLRDALAALEANGLPLKPKEQPPVIKLNEFSSRPNAQIPILAAEAENIAALTTAAWAGLTTCTLQSVTK